MIGRSFGNYRAISLLGEGGMGAVYIAEHPSIGRRVAVKVLRGELTSDAGLVSRFLNEARAASAIRHPNIIDVLDLGTLDDGMPYIAMELLDGESLAGRLRTRKRLSVDEVVEIVDQVAAGLAAAHEKGIVHRDLKPDNIFIVPDDRVPGRERVKVLDFGIAKLQQTFGGSESRQTRTGAVLGTPAYMSPEQCLGSKPVDARTDVYAVGIILFEMLAGRPPFVSTGFGETLNMHMNSPAPSVRELAPEAPAWIEAIIARTLEKAPGQRFSSMTELREALARRGAGFVSASGSSPKVTVPVEAHGETVAQTTTLTGITGEMTGSQATRPRRGLMVGAAVLVIAAAAAGIGMLARPGRSDVASAPVARPAEPPAAAPVPARVVRISVSSEPAGAEITSAEDGTSLGTTPTTITRPPGDKELKLRIHKAGFTPFVTGIALDRDHDLPVAKLVRIPTAKPRKPAAGTAEPGKL